MLIVVRGAKRTSDPTYRCVAHEDTPGRYCLIHVDETGRVEKRTSMPYAARRQVEKMCSSSSVPVFLDKRVDNTLVPALDASVDAACEDAAHVLHSIRNNKSESEKNTLTELYEATKNMMASDETTFRGQAAQAGYPSYAKSTRYRGFTQKRFGMKKEGLVSDVCAIEPHDAEWKNIAQYAARCLDRMQEDLAVGSSIDNAETTFGQNMTAASLNIVGKPVVRIGYETNEPVYAGERVEEHDVLSLSADFEYKGERATLRRLFVPAQTTFREACHESKDASRVIYGSALGNVSASIIMYADSMPITLANVLGRQDVDLNILAARMTDIMFAVDPPTLKTVLDETSVVPKTLPMEPTKYATHAVIDGSKFSEGKQASMSANRLVGLSLDNENPITDNIKLFLALEKLRPLYDVNHGKPAPVMGKQALMNDTEKSELMLNVARYINYSIPLVDDKLEPLTNWDGTPKLGWNWDKKDEDKKSTDKWRASGQPTAIPDLVPTDDDPTLYQFKTMWSVTPGSTEINSLRGPKNLTPEQLANLGTVGTLSDGSASYPKPGVWRGVLNWPHKQHSSQNKPGDYDKNSQQSMNHLKEMADFVFNPVSNTA